MIMSADCMDGTFENQIRLQKVEYEEIIAEKDAALAEKDNALAEKDAALAEKVKEIEQLKAMLNQNNK